MTLVITTAEAVPVVTAQVAERARTTLLRARIRYVGSAYDLERIEARQYRDADCKGGHRCRPEGSGPDE